MHFFLNRATYLYLYILRYTRVRSAGHFEEVLEMVGRSSRLAELCQVGRASESSHWSPVGHSPRA